MDFLADQIMGRLIGRALGPWRLDEEDREV
jgi:hypothetical protein